MLRAAVAAAAGVAVSCSTSWRWSALSLASIGAGNRGAGVSAAPSDKCKYIFQKYIISLLLSVQTLIKAFKIIQQRAAIWAASAPNIQLLVALWPWTYNPWKGLGTSNPGNLSGKLMSTFKMAASPDFNGHNRSVYSNYIVAVVSEEQAIGLSLMSKYNRGKNLV